MPAGSCRRRVPQASRAPSAARQPEGEAELRELRQVHDVALSVNRLAAFIEAGRAPGGSVVTAGRRAFDDETVDAAAGLAGEHGGEGVACNDGEELRTPDRRRRGGPQRVWIEGKMLFPPRGQPFHVEPERGWQVLGEAIERRRDITRDACTHQDDVDAGQHGAVQRRKGRNLDLGEEVHPHHARMPLLGQVHLDERREHRHELPGWAHHLLVHRKQLVGSAGWPACRKEIESQCIGGHTRHRERRHGPPHVTTGIAVLKPSHQHRIDGGAGDHAELATGGDRAREAPVGNADAHSTLDDRRNQRSDEHGTGPHFRLPGEGILNLCASPLPHPPPCLHES